MVDIEMKDIEGTISPANTTATSKDADTLTLDGKN